MSTSPSGTASARKRVLIVDDHAMMRDGLARLIAAEPNLEVCGEAGDGFQALDLAAATKPDLVLADITMPGKSGVEFIKDLRAAVPGTAVLVVSMHDETLYAERALRAGARGYIMKQEGGQRLIHAIRQVLSGKAYVSEKIFAKIVDLFSGNPPRLSGSPIASWKSSSTSARARPPHRLLPSCTSAQKRSKCTAPTSRKSSSSRLLQR